MEQAKVPQFGDWESEEIPYTICFDNAGRKGKKSDQLYQTDQQGNLEFESKGHKVSATASPKHEQRFPREGEMMKRSTRSPLHPNVIGHVHATARSDKQDSDMLKVLDVHRLRHDRQRSRDEGDMKTFTDSPLHNETAGRRTGSGDNTPSRVSRQSAGSNRSVEPSPLPPHVQARVGGKGSGVSSPSWERKATTERISSPSWERKAPSERSHGLSPSTPGRSRLRSVTRGDETPDHSPVIPKFGEWDVTDPTSAEEYSHIFSRVREEKNSDTGKVPAITTDTNYSNSQKHYENNNVKVCGCFPWSKR